MRKEGFYWVMNRRKRWTIADWKVCTSKNSILFGQYIWKVIGLDGSPSERRFLKIIEEPILLPDQKIKEQ